jgi:tetratricopeptide (TPR) repeat protein
MILAMSSTTNRSPFTRLLLALGFVSVMIFGITRYLGQYGMDLPEGVSRDQYESAARVLTRKFGKNPDRFDVLSLLGEMALGDEHLETALTCFRSIPSTHEKYGLAAELQQGEILIRLNRAPPAEQALKEFLHRARIATQVSAEDLKSARDWLRYLYSVEMRFEERKPILAELHQSGNAIVSDSKQYYFPSLLIWNSSTGRELLHQFLEQTPDDPQLKIAEGRYLTGEGRLAEARALLEELRKRMGDDKRCLSALLECHFESDDWASFRDVMQGVAPVAPNDPWLLTQMRGEYALHMNEWKEAIWHFKRLLDEDATNMIACMGLSRAYRQLGLTDENKKLQLKSLGLARIRPRLQKVTETDFNAAEELAEECVGLGLDEAAEVFRQHARRIRESSGR